MIKEAILRWVRARNPDFIIGGSESPYMLRHWLLPRNPLFNIYVHQFLRSDDDRALHDHPWLFNFSWLIDGEYIEWVSGYAFRKRFCGEKVFRWGRSPHRVQLIRKAGDEKPCWTVFITGPRVRQWGFYCDQGWVHWKRFTNPTDKGAIGAGCDQ